MTYLSAEFEQATTANTGSVSLSVPGGCKLVVVLVSGYASVVGIFSGGTLTIGGQSMTAPTNLGDQSTSFFMGAAFYRINPPTGTQTLAWDWSGAGAINNDAAFLAAYYDDVAVTHRAASGVQAGGTPYTTPSIAAQAGDLLCCGAWCFAEPLTGAFTFTGITNRSEGVNTGGCDMGVGDKTASGAQTVSAAYPGGSDGGSIGIAFQLSSASAGVLGRRIYVLP